MCSKINYRTVWCYCQVYHQARHAILSTATIQNLAGINIIFKLYSALSLLECSISIMLENAQGMGIISVSLWPPDLQCITILECQIR